MVEGRFVETSQAQQIELPNLLLVSRRLTQIERRAS
jgi:hypothetical protein